MDVKNCKNCGRLFNYISGVQMCPACREELEQKFQKAKEFIKSNSNVTVSMVAEEVDVPEKQVREWIKDERLVFSNAEASGITCEVCGEPITTGKYCNKCKTQVMRDLNSVIPKPAAPVKKVIKETSAKMRFLDNR